MNEKLLEKVIRYKQSNLKRFVTEKLKESYEEVVSDNGYVYAKGSFPVMLIAHMDTVHKSVPSKIIKTRINGKTSWTAKEGIGGDDRCGIYMIFQLIKKYNCSVLFTEDEEIGGVGASKFIKTDLCKSLKNSFCYLIEIDRRGDKDAVFYDCENDEFTEFIESTKYFKTSLGTYTDICTIGPAVNAASVNFSSGYYNAHQTSEYIVLEEMDRIISEIKKILSVTNTAKKYEHVEAYLPWNGYGKSKYYSGYGSYYSNTKYYGYSSMSRCDACRSWDCDNCDMYNGFTTSSNKIENTDREQEWWITFRDNTGADTIVSYHAFTKYEALGFFMEDYADRCYDDVDDVYCEDDMLKDPFYYSDSYVSVKGGK